MWLTQSVNHTKPSPAIFIYLSTRVKRPSPKSEPERLEQYFAANEITDNNKKRAVLLSVCGAKTYKLIRNLVNPRKPTDKSFVELVNLVKNHLNPRPSSIVHRFKFNNRFRQPGEQYNSMSLNCEFGDQLEKMLRDRLVCGLNDERIQRRLLAESQLEFKKAMELATAMVPADKNTRDLIAGNLSEKPRESQINCVAQDPSKQPARDPRKSTKECYRRGGRFHDPDKCRYKDEECYKCRKNGHKASQCLGKRKSEFRKSGKFGNTHHLEATDESGEEECEEYTMFHITATEREPYRVQQEFSLHNYFLEGKPDQD